MSKGHIRRRGSKSFELKFDAGRDPATGKRKVQYHTIRGTKRQAQVKLAEMIASVSTNTYVAPDKITVADHVNARIDQWEAAGDISGRTAERYRQLAKHQIIPHIGAKPIQKLAVADIEKWHSDLRASVSNRTIGHAHRVLSKAVSDAERHGLIHRNVCRLQRPPRPVETEMVIVQDVPDFLDKLPKEHRLYPIAMAGLFTGKRLGEILALRWRNADLDRGVIQVREALETVGTEVSIKQPKTKAGRRYITLSDILLAVLREHRNKQLELRMRLGAGKLPIDAFVFSDLEGEHLKPALISDAWRFLADGIGMLEITFHALRHTHASQLIDASVDIVTISKRLGHAKPDITLRVYAHLFRTVDSKAAMAINAALGGMS